MPTYRVVFQYTRQVVTRLQADSERDIHEFIRLKGDDWNALDYAPEIIDEDVSTPDYEFTTFGDYRIEAEEDLEADYRVVDDELEELT